jgi:glyoxylase I family protein
MQISVEHIGLPARNPTELKEWYVRVLNGKIIFESNTMPPAFFVQIGGAMLEIYEGDFSLKETSDNKLNGFRHLALRVDSIPSAKTQLEQRGVRFSEDAKPAGGGGRVLFFPDAEGNLLHLVERPLDSIFNSKTAV